MNEAPEEINVTTAPGGNENDNPGHSYGGALLYSTEIVNGIVKDRSKCTAGFGVRSLTTPTLHGLSTAGHCALESAADGYELSKWRRYIQGPAPATKRNLTRRGAAVKAAGDVAWYSVSGRAPSDDIYTHSRDWATGKEKLYVADITGIMLPSQGLLVCVMGQTSFDMGSTVKCSKVYKTNIHHTTTGRGGAFPDTTLKTQVAVEDYITRGGDSGGPWYTPSEKYAVGIHQGYHQFGSFPWTKKKRSIFTPVTGLGSLLGVEVMCSTSSRLHDCGRPHTRPTDLPPPKPLT